MKILLVDDDNGTLVTLSLALAQRGVQVDTASDGVKALRMLERHQYEWLITDASMAPMDGFELARRAKDAKPTIKIVMISGVCDTEDVKDVPVSRLFTKPVDPDTLCSFLKSVPA
ncbi:MAG: response regulator [Elusimicrobiota bacterium]